MNDDELIQRIKESVERAEREPVPQRLQTSSLASLAESHRQFAWLRMRPAMATLATGAALAAVMAISLVALHAHNTNPGVVTPPPASASVPVTFPATPFPTATPQPTQTPTSTPTPTPPASNVLFSDDFAADTVGAHPDDGWTIDSGAWQVAQDSTGKYAHSSGSAESRLSVGSAWTDYTLSAQIRAEPGAAVAGLGVRYQDANNYDFCKLTPGKLIAGTFHNGQASIVSSTPSSAQVNAWYQMTVAMTGSQMTCTLEGTPALSATVSTFASGRIALLGTGTVDARAVTVTSG